MWKYFTAFNGEYDADEQGFAESAEYAYKVAKEMKDPVFVEVNTINDVYEYVVIYERGTMPEDIDWLELIEADSEDDEDEEEE
jgi:hypothetical protein